MSDRICRRCGSVLLAPAVLVEITFHGAGRPERDAYLICRECADACICYLQSRREVLSPLAVSDPPLHTVTR